MQASQSKSAGVPLRVLQAYLWLICAFHALTGLGINFSRPFMESMAVYYGAKVDFTPQFVTLLHPLGAFMFVLGVIAAVAASDPVRYRLIVYCFAALFVIRALQRVIFMQDIEGAFHIDPARNLFNVAFFTLMGISLAALQRFVETRSLALPQQTG